MTTIDLPHLLNKPALDYYMNLPFPDEKIEATYIWIDGKDEGKICSKIRTLEKKRISSLKDVPGWYDSIYDDDHNGIEIYLEPVGIYRNPFSLGKHVLVLCDVYLPDKNGGKKPALTNKRPACLEAHERSRNSVPWFGIEQEFYLMDINNKPLGWPEAGFPLESDLFNYNAVGADRVIGRQISNAHYRACLYAGLSICGTSAETSPAQWEYQIGPISGIEVSDQILLSRYILMRVAEDFQVSVSFDPKPVKGWSGSSCHTNFSTKAMREEEGLKEIQISIEKLRVTHEKHLRVYDLNQGEDNKRRLLDSHAAPSIEFKSGIFKTGCSVRIPRCAIDEGKGYLEDRRPASDCNPYAVVNALLRTCVLDELF